jgi:REP element-mobilizing transposase RayT
VGRPTAGGRPQASRQPTLDAPSCPAAAIAPASGPHHSAACFRPLRSQHVLPTLRLAIAGANRREPERFRITHSTVQYDHIHLIVEAVDKQALSSGMSSVTIRIARSVNALVERRGRFWADRWHGRALTTPRQVRTALVYVLANFRKHSRHALGPGIDRYSSGAWFDGWQRGPALANGSVLANGWVQPGPSGERAPPIRDHRHDNDTLHHAGARPVRPEPAPVLQPRTWLARVGWRRYGLLRLDEAPAGAPRSA